ncbi:hypothetical protein [Bradyrhizobium sp. Cp5.3]|uniref:hypothetical protein n=1 Tax=Bradyrhizobium sp. Cp5.3 TaxID=443598 RepID=UPI0003FD6B1B|nr:hypothetical protein [Bradyrhizobium sp. Cp5.3]
MIRKTFVSQIAIRPRSRVIATALVYGLSLAVRFTSATGEEVEIPLQSLPTAMSTMTKDGAQLPYADWSPNATQSIFLGHGWPLRASSMTSCSSP